MNVLDKLLYLITNSWSNIILIIEPLIKVVLIVVSFCVILFWPILLAFSAEKVLDILNKKPKAGKLYYRVLPTTVTIFQILWFCACIKTMIDYI